MAVFCKRRYLGESAGFWLFFHLLKSYHSILSISFGITLPNLMPIAFDGGGVFYCYDFRQPDLPPQVVMSSSGNLGESSDELIPVGNTLAEVLAKEIMLD